MPSSSHDASYGLRCLACSRSYGADEVRFTCPACGDERGLLEVEFDLARIDAAALRRDTRPGLARWAPLLPLSGRVPLPPLTVGDTPLYDAPRLAQQCGVREVRVKDDGRNPTGSLKDRASAVALVKGLEAGEPLIAAASTGNAASSLAGLAASTGTRTVIFVPHTAPPAKLVQLLIYGAHVVTVNGSYDDAFELCVQATREFGWYNRNTGFNPYCLEGKKTAALEMAAQYDFDVPDRVFVSVGDGCILGGLHKGFSDLARLGLITRMPRLMAVQAEGSAAIARAFRGEGPAEIDRAQTLADSISVNKPRTAVQALRALHDSKGDVIVVSDQEILDAMRVLARSCGVFGEPAGAAALAGLLRASQQGMLGSDERVAVLVTGNGLKDVASAQKATDRQPTPLEADAEALRQFCNNFVAQHDLCMK